MSEYDIEEGLQTALDELNQTKGVEGAIIVSSVGEVVIHTLKSGGDLSLFGPMAQVIDSSSQRLLGSAGQGKMEKVLLEAKKGKSLFLQLEKVHLIILIEKKANLGMVMRAAHRVSPQIIENTRDMKVPEVEEPPFEEVAVEEPIAEETPVEKAEGKGIPAVEIQKPEVVSEAETVAEAEIPGEEIVSETEFIPTLTTEEVTPPVVLPTTESEVEEPPFEEVAVEEPIAKKPSEVIPSVKPPISLPDLPESVEIPDTPQGRADLIIEIYETLFLAMAIGASKIMGVSPARGLTKQFLPSSECKQLLEGVDVKSNAVIDFDALKKNAEKIAIEDREEVFLKDFSQIITVITDNYGKVMGYDAFRGMVRAEFRAINDSFGEAMDELGIKEKMHPELQKLL
jgi:predicted regulator of Ras-like GTPase activity (Roadblock/LC7/MglB family)